jgi:hypothetical protein
VLVISDIWRSDGRETLPLMPMTGRPRILVMLAILDRWSMSGPLVSCLGETDLPATG